MTDRHYLHSFAELIDRLSIVLMKSIFIGEHRDEYLKERDLIEHDIGGLLYDYGINLDAIQIRALLVLMLANRYIWENEQSVRAGGASDKLRATHSVNGVRNMAKNILAQRFGERQDLKIDCLAADLPTDCGDWRVF